MNALKFAFAAIIMAFSVQASVQMTQVVYLPDFPVTKAPAEPVNSDSTPVQASLQTAQVVYLPDFPATKAPAETVNSDSANIGTKYTA